MSTHLIWDNLVAYSMQIGLLVGLAAFVPALLRLKLPGTRLAYWHVLLAACLLLPAAPPRPPMPPSPIPKIEIGLLIVGAGAILRLLWLGAAFWRLKRLRRHSL